MRKRVNSTIDATVHAETIKRPDVKRKGYSRHVEDLVIENNKKYKKVVKNETWDL